jgi:hypothetical protein
MAIYGGLRTYSSIGQGAGSSVVLPFKIVSADSTDMFEGDIMKLTNAEGGVVSASGAADLALVGVFVGCEYTNSDGQRIHSNKYPGTTAPVTADDTVAYVNVNPFQTYIVRVGTGGTEGTFIREDAVGGNFDLDYANGGSATSGMSGMMLDTGTAQAATIAQVRVVDVSNDNGEAPATGATAKTFTHAIVMIDPLTSYWLAGNGIVA